MDSSEFERTYTDAYHLIDKGIVLITEGKNKEALTYFEHGLDLIEKALTVKVHSFDISAEKIQHFAEMQLKMQHTRKEIQTHFTSAEALKNAASNKSADELPPSYEEFLSSVNSEEENSLKGAVNYPDLKDINNQGIALPSPDLIGLQSPKHGELIFLIEHGVQIFFIYSNGRVTSPSYPSFLAIFTVKEPIYGTNASLHARGILQVGEWSYPLVPAQSPVLHSFYGAYMFPDFTNSVPGTSVGILIPDTCDKDTHDLFEQILNEMTSFQEQKVPSGVNVAEERAKVQKSAGEAIAEGAVAISKGVSWGAEKLENFITYSSEKLKESLPSEERRAVDPKWQKTAEIARNVSGTAVKISGFLVHNVGKATMALGRSLAPTIKKHGTKAIGHFTGQGEKQAESQVVEVLEVASGAVRGASTIYLSLEQAAYSLASSLADNTVKVVSHRYGEEAATVTGDTLYAVGQTAAAGYNFSSLGLKGIAKRTAKDTGKALLTSEKGGKVSPLEENLLPSTHGAVEMMETNGAVSKKS